MQIANAIKRRPANPGRDVTLDGVRNGEKTGAGGSVLAAVAARLGAPCGADSRAEGVGDAPIS